MGDDSKACAGPVAVFDILGYKAFLAKNDVAIQMNAAKSLFGPTSKLNEEVHESLKKIFSADSRFEKLDVSGLAEPPIVVSIFSDTIVATLDLNGLTKNKSDFCWVRFVLACQKLIQRTFAQGFPVRGAIAFGEYYLEPNLLLGQPFVEAFIDGQQFDWCGCVLSKSAEKRLIEAMAPLGKPNPFLFEYEVPLKDRSTISRKVLAWMNTEAKIGTPRDFFMDKFSRYSKTLTPDALRKVSNTEAFWYFSTGQKSSAYRQI